MGAISASGVSLCVRWVGLFGRRAGLFRRWADLLDRGFGLLVRREVGELQLQQRAIGAAVAASQGLVVLGNGAGNILLGIQGITVYFVVAAGEASRRAFGQILDGIVRLALIDQNTRETQASNLLELRILGVVHDLGQCGDGIGRLAGFDVDACNGQLRLVGIG